MEERESQMPGAQPGQRESTARGGAVTSPLRIGQMTVVVILLLASTYLLIYAFQKPGWWIGGWALLAIATAMATVTFRERT
jgi:hypothetical protein